MTSSSALLFKVAPDGAGSCPDCRIFTGLSATGDADCSDCFIDKRWRLDVDEPSSRKRGSATTRHFSVRSRKTRCMVGHDTRARSAKVEIRGQQTPSSLAMSANANRTTFLVWDSSHQITPPIAIQYIDKRGKVAGNREIALLRHILTKCVHWGILDTNALRGLQYRHPEKPRDRIVSPSDLRFVMRRAKSRERYLVWLIFLTGLRREDALRLTRWHCKPDGIHTTEGKTGKRVMIARTASLEKVIKRLQKLSGNAFFPVSSSGIDSEWQRLRARLKPDFDLFQLKDVRAAHAGAFEDIGGDATKQLGHSSRALTNRHYLRGGRKVTPIR